MVARFSTRCPGLTVTQRRRAVRQAFASGWSVKRIMAELHIDQHMIYAWVGDMKRRRR